MRSTRMTVVYPFAFRLSGYRDDLPAGDYELLIQEQSVIGPGQRIHRWTAAYLTVQGARGKAGRADRRPLSGPDLERALSYRRLPPPLDGRVPNAASGNLS
jgi:hypothetical protein